MDPNDLKSVIERLERLEQRLDVLERMARPVASGPPPRILHEPPPPVPVATLHFDVGEAPPPKVAPAPSFDELRFGGRALPLVGAVVFLLGIASLVGLGISRGLLTPLVQFYGALSLSLAFVVAGVIKRDEHEEFGQVLAGIGACGLYLTAAGGYAFLDLYGSKELLGAMLAISLANFGFSAWRRSQPFYWLGVVGGMVAAYFPISTGDFGLVVALHMLVLVTAYLIAGRARWTQSVALTWVVGSLAIELLAYRSGSEHQSLLLLLLHGFASAATLAWATRFEPVREDPRALASIGMLVVAALRMVFVPMHFPVHPYVLALAALAAAAGLAMPKVLLRERFIAAALVLAVAIAPWSNPDFSVVSYAFAALAAFGVVAVFVRPTAWLAWLAAALWAEGVGAMVLARGYSAADPRLMTLGLSGSLSAVAFLVAAAFRRIGDAQLSGFALVMATPVVALLSYSVLFPYDPTHFVATSFGLYVMGAVLLAAARILETEYLRTFGWVVAGAGFLSFWAGVTQNNAGTLPNYSALLGLFVLGALTLADTRDKDRDRSDTARFLFGVMGGSLLVRFMREGFIHGFAMHPEPALALAFVSFVIGLCGWAIVRPSRGLVSAAVIYGALAMATAASLPDSIVFVAVIYFLLVVAAIVFGVAVAKISENPATGYVTSAVLAWIPFSLFGHEMLSGVVAQFSPTSALTFTWIAFGALVLAAGFWLKAPWVRIVGLVVFAMTVAKVMTVDIADLDPLLRIIALLVLGATLIGSGYAYLWFQRRSAIPPPSD